jgi:hypothetical protein
MKQLVQKQWPPVFEFLRKWGPVLLVVGISAALYLPSRNWDFLRWDDRQHIQLNPWLQNQIFYLIWTKPYYNMYIPITYSVWSVVWTFSKEPWIFHWMNIVFHALNAVLVYWLARQVMDKKQDKVAAALAALLFACHPLQVETVAWISSGRDVLSGFLSLLAVNWLIARDDLKAAFGTFVLFAAALLCKPAVAILPIALAPILWGMGRLTKPRIFTLGFWVASGVVASIITKRIQQLDADLRLTPMGLGDRILVAIDAFSFYVQKYFVPIDLAADYGRTREIALNDHVWMYGAAGIVACAIFLYAIHKHLPERFLYFGAWFVIVLVPVLGVVPFQAQATSTVSDRYAYMPLIGLGLAIACLSVGRRWAQAALAIVVVGWFVTTQARSEVWSTNEIFFRDMLAKNDRSNVAYGSLGVEMILQNRLDQAEPFLNSAVKLKPTDVIPRTNLAQLFLLQNNPERVVREVVPLLEDQEFLRINQTETRALASAYRLSGRAFWMLRQWSRANLFYCRWYNLDYENEEGKVEITRFMEDAKRAGAPPLPNCQVQLAY